MTNVVTSEILFQEQIDKFEEAADGINADMALAEKALKVGGGNFIRIGWGKIDENKNHTEFHPFTSLVFRCEVLIMMDSGKFAT